MRTALVIGATGLVGKSVVQQLLADKAYSKVIALVRRPTQVRDGKYEEHVVDFGKPETFAEVVKGDVLFSAMGTTRDQAGSVEAQRVVDYTYQLEVAKLAARNGVKTYVLISSGGAKASSPFAYMRMKGELERDVQALGLPSVQILRPGLLEGVREKPRTGEKVSSAVLHAVTSFGLFQSARPITGEQVARAMRHAATLEGTRIHQPGDLFAMQ